jgi:lysozyme family protein
MTNFEYALPFILVHEGGWVNDPSDRGGETFQGISRNNFPNWPGWRLIDIARNSPTFPACIKANGNLPELVADFYRRDFWQPSWDQLDKRVAAKVMDISVNAGISWGPKILQRALRVTDDGIVGPHTIEAANNTDTDTLLQAMCDQMDKHYDAIVEAHPEDQKFLKGWEARAAWMPPTA